MNPRPHSMPCRLAMSLFLAAGLLPLAAAPEPAAPAAKHEIAKSVFVYPTKPQEGRDPFFPDSLRVYTSSVESQARGPALSDLSLKSILGSSPRFFAIINNHTFATGDDGDIITKSGQRLHIRCVDINPKAGTATVEASGMSQVLHISGDQ